MQEGKDEMKRVRALPTKPAAGILVFSFLVVSIALADAALLSQEPANWSWIWRQPPYVFDEGLYGYVYIWPAAGLTTWGGEHGDKLYVVTNDHEFENVPPGGIYTSQDLGRTWAHIPDTDDTEFTHLVIHPITPTVVLAGIDNAYPPGGIQRSVDGGENWSSVLPGKAIDDIEIDPNDPRRMYAATCCTEIIHRSDDTGVTWYPIANQGLDDIEVHPTSANTLFGARSRSTRPDEGIYRSDDFGETWRQIASIVGTPRVIIDDRQPDRMFAFGSERIYRSEDGGASWQDISDGLPGGIAGRPLVKAAALDPFALDTLWVGLQYTGMFVSYNAGDTWHAVNRGLYVASAFGVECTSISFSALGDLVVTCNCRVYLGAEWDHRAFLPLVEK